MPGEDRGWRRPAACAVLGELYFAPPSTRRRSGPWSSERAKAVCAQRPVAANCRAWAIRTRQTNGVWGRRRRRIAQAPLAVHAPRCKACLRILDREFAQPVPDERLAWNVIRAVEELEQWGCIHIVGVPAEQAELLRTSVRAKARMRGWRFHSMVAEGQLIASGEHALSPERREFVMHTRCSACETGATPLCFPNRLGGSNGRRKQGTERPWTLGGRPGVGDSDPSVRSLTELHNVGHHGGRHGGSSPLLAHARR